MCCFQCGCVNLIHSDSNSKCWLDNGYVQFWHDRIKMRPNKYTVLNLKQKSWNPFVELKRGFIYLFIYWLLFLKQSFWPLSNEPQHLESDWNSATALQSWSSQVWSQSSSWHIMVLKWFNTKHKHAMNFFSSYFHTKYLTPEISFSINCKHDHSKLLSKLVSTQGKVSGVRLCWWTGWTLHVYKVQTASQAHLHVKRGRDSMQRWLQRYVRGLSTTWHPAATRCFSRKQAARIIERTIVLRHTHGCLCDNCEGVSHDIGNRRRGQRSRKKANAEDAVKQ